VYVKFSSVWPFFRQQIVYLGLSAALVAIFWAIGERSLLPRSWCTRFAPGISSRLQWSGWVPLFGERPFPYNWVIFLAVLMVLSVPVYLISTAAVWLIIRPATMTLPDLIETAWRFPLVATLVFGGVSFMHQTTKDRLEQRNRELQQSVEKGAQQLELQAQEMQRAREIQQSLLPKEIPQLAGFEVAAAWRPAREVSGDYYDVFKLDEHRLGVCIADVVGKGVAAALLMANVQAAVRAYASSAESARAVVHEGQPAALRESGDRKVCDVPLWRAGQRNADVRLLQRGECLPDSGFAGEPCDPWRREAPRWACFLSGNMRMRTLRSSGRPAVAGDRWHYRSVRRGRTGVRRREAGGGSAQAASARRRR
jgi:hypothetical protein